MDDKSDVQVWNNDIAGYFFGFCVQTSYADVKGNHVSDSCLSVSVDPGIVGAKVRWNHIRKSAEVCRSLPFPASFGIIIGGARDTMVKWNYVEGIDDGGKVNETGVGVSCPSTCGFGRVTNPHRCRLVFMTLLRHLLKR